MSDLKFHWTYDNRLEAYIFGISDLGGGVFQDSEKWFGNSVVPGSDINSFGPYETKLEAQLAVEEDFVKRTA